MTKTNFSPDVVEALRERGWHMAEIEVMGPAKAFDEYCMWHGLIGWGPRLRDAYESTHGVAREAQS